MMFCVTGKKITHSKMGTDGFIQILRYELVLIFLRWIYIFVEIWYHFVSEWQLSPKSSSWTIFLWLTVCFLVIMLNRRVECVLKVFGFIPTYSFVCLTPNTLDEAFWGFFYHFWFLRRINVQHCIFKVDDFEDLLIFIVRLIFANYVETESHCLTRKLPSRIERGSKYSSFKKIDEISSEFGGNTSANLQMIQYIFGCFPSRFSPNFDEASQIQWYSSTFLKTTVLIFIQACFQFGYARSKTVFKFCFSPVQWNIREGKEDL